MRTPLRQVAVSTVLLASLLAWRGVSAGPPGAALPARFARLERGMAQRIESCHRRAAARERRGLRADPTDCLAAARARRRRAPGPVEPRGIPGCHPAELSDGRSGRPAPGDPGGDLARPQALAVRDRHATWPTLEIPYEIHAGVPPALRESIAAAVAHWNAHTLLELRPRAAGDPDYLVFREYVDAPLVGSSYIGRIRGPQEVLLGRRVPAGVVIHEIGHAVGLLHEHGRQDRDAYVAVHWQNIDPLYRGAFEKVDPSYAAARGPYDFGSIMHYWDGAFSRNGQPTLSRLDGSPLGTQGEVLSDLDIAGFTRVQVRGPSSALENHATGRCLDIAGGRIARGIAGVGRACRGSARQRWTRYSDPRSGALLLVNRRSGMCLGVPGGSRVEDVRLIQTPCHGGPSQQFALSTKPDEPTLRSRASGLCVEARWGAAGRADRVVQARCSASTAQRWRLSSS